MSKRRSSAQSHSSYSLAPAVSSFARDSLSNSGNYSASSNGPPSKKLKEDPNQSRLGPNILERYDDFVEIGSGTYGKVFQAREKSSNKKVAIKLFHKTKEGEGISLTAYRELMLLKELKNENIVNLISISVSTEEKSIALILDYAEYDLSEIIRYHNRRGPEPLPVYTIKSVMWQVLNAIHYLHSNWVCHRDMKPSNILIMGKGMAQEGVIKIADFGLARIFQSPIRPLFENGVVVTIWYRAPELLLGSKHYTKAVDMWAIGCIFSELMTTVALFQGKEKDQKNPNLFQDIQLDRIFRVLGKPNTKIWPDLQYLPDWRSSGQNKWKDTIIEKEWNNYSDHETAVAIQAKSYNDKQAFELMNKMLEYDPSKRISASDALDHPFFKSEPIPGRNVFSLTYPPRQNLTGSRA